MNPNRAFSHDRFAQDFHTFGHDGLALSRADERRASEQQRDAIAAAIPGARPLAGFRRAIGDRLIAAGSRLAGTNAVTPALPVVTIDLAR